MTGADAAKAYAAFLRGPTVDELARALPDLGDHTATLLSELARSPSPDRCDRALVQLDGARQLVARLRGSLVREGTGDGQCAG